MSRLLPDGLAGRFALLLVAALVTANLVALAVMSYERQRLDREALQLREVERIVSLVPAIEEAPPIRRKMIARRSSTRFSRVSVDREPIIRERATAPRSAALTQRLTEALPDRELRAAIRVRQRDPEASRVSQTIAISIALRVDGGRAPQWLNMVSRGTRPRPPGIAGEVFWLTLAVSLISVLGVGLLFVRRLTQPLGALARAARAAGHGDRSARAPETGAREMREAARAFNAMQVEMSQIDAERMRMLAAVGHDLRTPMTGLRIRAEMVEDDAQREAMTRILDEMGVMADGLVSYAKEGHDGEDSGPLDLAPFLSQLCTDRGAACTVHAQAVVTARPVGLGRAIGNLIDNAQRYGGTARVSLDVHKDDAVIEIDDDGPGIAESQLETLFQPFTRGEQSRNSETGGAGLGLSIARNMIVAHGGQISLENRSAGGLRVTVTLPLARP